MDLTLLIFGDGRILLHPTGQCGIKRNSDGKIKSYLLDDSGLNSQLGHPGAQSPYRNFHSMFLSRFTQYVIVNSTGLKEDIIFVFGKSEVLNNRDVFILAKVEKDSIRDLVSNGITLDDSMLIGGGTTSQGFESLPYQQYSKQLFTQMKSLIRVHCNEPGDRNCILNFTDSNGEWFYSEYVSTKLYNVEVSQSGNDEKYIKTLH